MVGLFIGLSLHACDMSCVDMHTNNRQQPKQKQPKSPKSPKQTKTYTNNHKTYHKPANPQPPQPPQRRPPPHSVLVQKVAHQWRPRFFPLCQTPAVDIVMDVARVTGSAQRRRARRLRAWQRHVRTAVQLALADHLHQSANRVERDAAPR